MKRLLYTHFFGLMIILLLNQCAGLKNPERPEKNIEDPGYFIKTTDQKNIYIYSYQTIENPKASIYILSGITGINHHREKEIISLLNAGQNRVVIIHPRGTGYSEGQRGDIQNFQRFLQDYHEVIETDFIKARRKEKLILYGHSMSTAMVLEVAKDLPQTNGIILINPPYKLKESPGMTPSLLDYINYAGYFIFAPHTPIVNMAGNPEQIANPEERKEAQLRNGDPLLVKYFSMYMMFESKKLMDNMVQNATKMDIPLLLIYGTADSIVDKTGCDAIFENWKHPYKTYFLAENGPHGKKTVIDSAETISAWISDLP